MINIDIPHIHSRIDLMCSYLYASQDPLPEHFEASREIITTDISSINGRTKYIDIGVDLLARELVKHCVRFREKIESLEEAKLNEIFFRFFDYTIQDMLWIDAMFFDFLSSIGKTSSTEADIQRHNSKERFSKWRNIEVENIGSKIWSLWSLDDNEGDIFKFTPQFLYILAYGLWNDIIKNKWEKQIKNIPALTKAALMTTIKPSLYKGSHIEENHNAIVSCTKAGEIYCTVPFIDQKLVNLVCKGMKCLSSLNGHRLLRWEVKTGFNQWINEVQDPRLIRTSGGYRGIANLIGAGQSHKGISEVKAMLHAQAHGHFVFPQGGSGNMICLREIEQHKNGEPSKINLLLGEFLFPNFTHHLPPGEKRRLVPIIDLPPLVGSENTHAAQAMLQLLILEEFSKQSDRFAIQGSILLPKDKLRELCMEAQLPPTFLEKVMSAWVLGDSLSKPFLQVNGDEYALSSELLNVSDFLEQQGKLRIEGAKRGKKSANARKKTSKVP